MRAITYDRHGGADVLQLTDQPVPPVGPDAVLVRVHATAVNPVDRYVRAGGLDDEVFGYVRRDWVHGGTFAEYVAAPVRTLARKPAALSFEEAAGVPLAGLTAYQTIVRSGLRAGQTLRVHLDRVLDLEDAAEAHRLVEAGGVPGKVVFQVR